MARPRIPEVMYNKIRKLYSSGKINKDDISGFVQEIKNVYKDQNIKAKSKSDLYRSIALMDPALKEKYGTILNEIEPTGGYNKYLKTKDKYTATYGFFQNLIDSGQVSKSEAKDFLEEMGTTADRFSLDLKTSQDFKKVLSKMDTKVISKYPSIYEKINTGADIFSLEKKIGSAGTDFIVRETDSEMQKKRFGETLDRIKQDPKFNEFRGKYKDFLQKDYGLSVDNIEQIYDFNLEELQQTQDVTERKYDNLLEDVETYTQYAKDDYIDNLSKTDNQLAGALQRATETYGQRNLLQSGLSRLGKQNIVDEGSRAKSGLESNLDRRVSELVTQQERGKEAYQDSLNRLELDRNKLDYKRDTSLKQAKLGLDKSGFDIENKQTEQAYGQAISQYGTDQSNRIRQVLGSLYK